MNIINNLFFPGSLTLGIVLGNLLNPGPVSAAVVFDFGFVNGSTDDSLSGGEVASYESRFHQSSTLPPAGLTALSTLMVRSGAKTNPDFARSMSSATATFALDGASGKFVFNQNTDIVASKQASLSAYADAVGTALYTFNITSPAVFSLKYIIKTMGRTGQGRPPSEFFSLIDDSDFSSENQPIRLDRPGSYVSPMLSPGKYQFSVQNYDVNYASLVAPGAVATSLDSRFTFRIGAVPEPSTWLMTLVGVGGLGVALRRRSRRAGRV